MLYNCNICGKQFKQKCHYTNHLNRINPCINLTKKIPKNPPISPEIPPTSTKKYSCSFCKDQFTRSDHLKRHLDRCKIRKEETSDKELIYQELLRKMETYEKEKDNQDNLIKELNNKIEKLENEKKHTQNNKNIKNQNNGTINNINIIQFGKEDLSAIDNKPFFEALNAMGYNIPVKMVEGIHANDLHPEFKNIYISDINREKAMVHNGSSWILDKFDNVSDQILDKSINFLEDRFKQLKKEMRNLAFNLDFEEAIKIRDKIREIENI